MNIYIYIYVYEYNCHLRSGRNISSCRLEPGDSNLEMKWEGFWLKQITAAVSQAKVARRPWIGRSLSLSEWLRQMQTGTRDKGRWETMGLKGRNKSPGPATLTSCEKTFATGRSTRIPLVSSLAYLSLPLTGRGLHSGVESSLMWSTLNQSFFCKPIFW